MTFFPYILASRRNGTLYTGSTDQLIKRVNEHRSGRFGGFTSRYGVALLVWFERHETRHAAFVRERQIKDWKRIWKLELIERSNPGCVDLMDRFGLVD
ncbi:GIY-YIG nuclease family protein [Brevundimonas variabilis]|uniref:Putative endonuclease n=1 Tax=Brevundimonas variabilis TaxID=74312 RepID=A0A7W9FHH2_9CAUL|nr:GIY-YIG nuclease family protein [Brevundimonas variabilis]MBB5747449.1 putative endonuclease [Brevundimonas variabilis]